MHWLTLRYSPCSRHPFQVYSSVTLTSSSVASYSATLERSKYIVAILSNCSSFFVFSPCSDVYGQHDSIGHRWINHGQERIAEQKCDSAQSLGLAAHVDVNGILDDNANINHTKNCTSTLRFLPSRRDGMTDDRTKTHEKAYTKIIMSILRSSHSPAAGHSTLKEVSTVDTAVWVKIW